MSVSTVNDGNFDAEVLQSRLPVVVEFASGNKASAKMNAVVDELAGLHPDTLKVMRKELDVAGVTERKFQVESAPTILLFKDGSKVREIVGYYSLDGIKTWIDGLLEG